MAFYFDDSSDYCARVQYVVLYLSTLHSGSQCQILEYYQCFIGIDAHFWYGSYLCG